MPIPRITPRTIEPFAITAHSSSLFNSVPALRPDWEKRLCLVDDRRIVATDAHVAGLVRTGVAQDVGGYEGGEGPGEEEEKGFGVGEHIDGVWCGGGEQGQRTAVRRHSPRPSSGLPRSLATDGTARRLAASLTSLASWRLDMVLIGCERHTTGGPLSRGDIERKGYKLEQSRLKGRETWIKSAFVETRWATRCYGSGDRDLKEMKSSC